MSAQGSRRPDGDDESRSQVVAALAAGVLAAWAIDTAGQTSGWSGWHRFYPVTVGLWGLVLSALLVARAFGRERSRALWFLVAAIPLNLTWGRVLLLTLGHSRESGAFNLSTHGVLAIVGVCLLLALATMGYLLERRQTPAARRHPPV